MGSLVQKTNRVTDQSCRGHHVTAELVPLSEVQCHARPVAARVGSLCS